MWDAYRPTWLLNVLVPGFDEMVHRLGATAAMSRKPFLPIVLRVPLLAGLAIAISDPVRTISRLRAHPRCGAQIPVRSIRRVYSIDKSPPRRSCWNEGGGGVRCCGCWS
jgi:hypothetical protein